MIENIALLHGLYPYLSTTSLRQLRQLYGLTDEEIAIVERAES